MGEQVKVIGFHELKKYEVEHLINTTSKSANWSKKLSPFFIGPVELYGGQTSLNMENAWQFAKVYSHQVDENQNPTEAYFQWAQKGWGDNFAHRYPMKKGSVPLFSYWDGEKLDYIEARKRIYAPLYAKAVLKTEAFQHLLRMYESKQSFALLDFDGYDYLSLGMSLKDVMEEPKKKMGHAFVLAMLLESPALRKKYES